MIKKFQEELRKKGVDAALILNLGMEKKDINLFYFTQVNIDFACLIVYKNKNPLLIVPKTDKDKLKGFSRIKNIRAIPKKKRLFEFLKDLVRGNKTIGLDEVNLTVYYYKLLKRKLRKKRIKDISKMLLDLRKIKNNGEIENIKRACKITDKIFSKVVENFKGFKKETDIKEFIISEAVKNSCEMSFEPIAASGKNATSPHYITRDVRLNRGFCVIDFGVKYKGYCSDISRTIYIGKISNKDKELYNFLLKVQKGIINEIKINGKCSGLHAEVKKKLEEYKKYFPHGLGHGLGAEVHEAPSIAEKSRDKFKNGMVFTIEPGIYLKGIGIRIEDDVLINKNKVVLLTKANKNLIIKN